MRDCLPPAEELARAKGLTRRPHLLAVPPPPTLQQRPRSSPTRRAGPFYAPGRHDGVFPRPPPGEAVSWSDGRVRDVRPLWRAGALRAENRAHFFARRDSRSYRWAEQQLVEVFCAAGRAWREAVVEKGVALIEQALKVCDRRAKRGSCCHGHEQ